MPNYDYYCYACDMKAEKHVPMGEYPLILCACGAKMNRLPSKILGVNWGGLKPSQGEYSDTFKEYFDTYDARRAAFEQKHEEHEKRTTND